MISWVTKNTAEYRIDTMSEVEDFHKKMQDQAADGGYTLSSFSWTKKEVKAQGEVVDEFFIVKVANVFNDPKNPELPFLSVEFPKLEANDAPQEEDVEW